MLIRIGNYTERAAKYSGGLIVINSFGCVLFCVIVNTEKHRSNNRRSLLWLCYDHLADQFNFSAADEIIMK